MGRIVQVAPFRNAAGTLYVPLILCPDCKVLWLLFWKGSTKCHRKDSGHKQTAMESVLTYNQCVMPKLQLFSDYFSLYFYLMKCPLMLMNALTLKDNSTQWLNLAHLVANENQMSFIPLPSFSKMQSSGIYYHIYKPSRVWAQNAILKYSLSSSDIVFFKRLSRGLFSKGGPIIQSLWYSITYTNVGATMCYVPKCMRLSYHVHCTYLVKII